MLICFTGEIKLIQGGMTLLNIKTMYTATWSYMYRYYIHKRQCNEKHIIKETNVTFVKIARPISETGELCFQICGQLCSQHPPLTQPDHGNVTASLHYRLAGKLIQECHENESMLK